MQKKQSNKLLLKNWLFFAIPFLFPIIAIIGTNLLDANEQSILPMFLIALIAVYVILLAIFSKNNRISKKVFPLAIFMIALTLLFMVSLRSGHIFGCDIHGEYFVFQLTKEAGLWKPNVYSYNPCLSITLLPTIYSLITNINGEYIFTILFQILFALTPLIIFLFVKKYTKPIYAFLSAFFFMSLNLFAFSGALARMEIALLFFALSILVFFDDINSNVKKFLFIIFGIIIILSHYTVSYVYFGLLLFAYIVNFNYKKRIKDPSSKKGIITAITIILFLALIFFWYGQITSTPFNGLVKFAKTIISNLANPFINELRSTGAISSISIPSGKTLIKLSNYISHLMKFFMIIGLFYLIKNFKKLKIERAFVIIAIYALIFVILSIGLPLISLGMNIERIFLQSLVILCFCCVIGAKFIFKKIKFKTHSAKILIAFLIILFFLFQSGFAYKVFNNPSSSVLDNNAHNYKMWYIHEQEINSAKWLSEQKPEKVYADHDALLRLWSYGNLPYPWTAGQERRTSVLTVNSTLTNSYVYLRRDNVINNNFLTRNRGEYIYIENLIEMLRNKNKMYDNKGAQIFK